MKPIYIFDNDKTFNKLIWKKIGPSSVIHKAFRNRNIFNRVRTTTWQCLRATVKSS